VTREATWREEFGRALEAHLTRRDEADLLSAYELGRRALESGLGVLDVAGLVHGALSSVCARAYGDPLPLVQAAEDVLLECLSPFEMAFRGVNEANTALRGLNDFLEEQTRRISHELHDEAGQLLASVHMALDGLGSELAPAAAARLDTIREMLDGIEEQLRRLSHELRPTILDDLGLGPALEFLTGGVSARNGVPISLEVVPEKRLSPRTEAVLYRIVQEALNNVAKHARASSVTIHVHTQDGTTTCSIKDDGVGFDVAAASADGQGRGIGLIGMRERLVPLGGALTIESQPGRGTLLVASIPDDGGAPGAEPYPNGQGDNGRGNPRASDGRHRV